MSAPARHVTRLPTLMLVAMALVGCGKKGPPLPPLVLLPAQPGDFTVVRRGDSVDLTFRIPSENTDRSTPADLQRVDVYALTAPEPATAEDVVRRGSRVQSVPVRKPRDPDEPEPEEPEPDDGTLQQGAVAEVREQLSPPADPSAYRAYVAAGINQRGRRGALSPRVSVPLVALPPTPAQPEVTYDEKSISLSWPPVTPADSTAEPYTYSVYRPGAATVPLTPAPVPGPAFAETSFEWEQERCYEVRAGSMVEGVRVEGDASPARCVTPHDTFAPAPPTGLVAVGSEGAISLIWSASDEPDLAGYLVLRAIAPATELTPISTMPMTDTNLRDPVPPGSQVTYAIQAVDTWGNRSEPSSTITETAR